MKEKKESLPLIIGVDFYPQGLCDKNVNSYKSCDFCFRGRHSPKSPSLISLGPDLCCTYFMCLDCLKRILGKLQSLKDDRLRILVKDGIYIDDSTI